ncbi:MAG: LytTR family DNA-binding domain-containing protein [Acidobacteriota bacterium]|nr:LytTR family DNA-binding domain-containing protein [Acidobacteriota bacterium]
MNILIVEDERIIAQRLERFIRAGLGSKLHVLQTAPSLSAARLQVYDRPWDLVFLDLNLKGRDGFELLQDAVASSFHTVVVSAYTDRAFEAFQYGVFDFIGKPFDEDRVAKTLNTFLSNQRGQSNTRTLAVKKGRDLKLIPLEDVLFIKAANTYSELHLVSGEQELHSKGLEQLGRVLPNDWVRVHKSYFVPQSRIQSWAAAPGSSYKVILTGNIEIPVSRRRYMAFKQTWLA